MMLPASTIGTSSGNGTSPYDATDKIATISLSDGTDVATRGQRNFYDGRATGSPVKKTLFHNICNKLKLKVHVKNPGPVKRKPQAGTAQNKLKELCQKLKSCKMGRRAWIKLIVVLSVLYPFLISSLGQTTLDAALKGIFMLNPTALSFLPGLAPFILFVIIYLCVLLCFCRSKTAKCLLDKMWKKKEKEEAPAETKNNEGKTNKESKKD
ncbi:hypothetical protein AK88_04182 [Plasmodium fragile]|uniref:Uncharacterized protein n=1 Tax=Plasmodium fragile TaxID=5857 RepID=A0A0D9QKH5_PLAFR|nr:uncharacterized protein AK88_04182 [Plasmodium fragile]KJP86211.1 hypothetical protein AK88_04182 [Plasmodium fragile]